MRARELESKESRRAGEYWRPGKYRKSRELESIREIENCKVKRASEQENELESWRVSESRRAGE